MSGVPPKKSEAYKLFFGLVSQADTNIFQANPTIAAGDFKVSKDSGATFANLTTLPAVVAGNTKVVLAQLSIAEMTPVNCDKVIFIGSDQAGAEWQDILIALTVTDVPIDELARQASITVTSTPDAGTHTVYRDAYWSFPFTGIGDISGRKVAGPRLYITLKKNALDTDAEAILQVAETGGLLVFNGAAGTAGDGVITVTDEVAGDLTLTVKVATTTAAPLHEGLVGDIKYIRAADDQPIRQASFKANIRATETEAIA